MTERPSTVSACHRKNSPREQSLHDGVVADIRAVGYSATANPDTINKPMVVLLPIVLMAYIGMGSYGSIAAMLVELIPPPSPDHFVLRE